MKKIVKYLAFILAFVISLPFAFCGNVAHAADNSSSVVSLTTFTNTAFEVLNDYSAFKNRLPGSDGEKQASEYIRNYLENKTSLVAKNTAYVKNGIQEFSFDSEISGIYEKSQNIIYTLNSTKETNKKVIIGCHYDSIAIDMDQKSENYGKYIDSESINGSAGNVATLLSIASLLSADNLDFNIEFVFFGAGESNNAGSAYYASGISKDDKKNIIAMININQITVGKQLYFYMNEVSTKPEKLVEDIVYDKKIDVEKINTAHLNKVMLDDENALGLSYKHVALDSDNINFMKVEIPTINIFAGDYSDGVIIGRQEFAGEDLITYTTNDNIEYILNNLSDYKMEENMYKVFKTVYYTLTDADFIEVFEGAKGETSWFYKIFASENLAFYLTVVSFIIFIIVAMYIYYKLSIKAYHANIEVEFLSSVVKIADQLDKSGKDENVAKVVSQVIANDIKKDKTIKVKPPKNDKKDK